MGLLIAKQIHLSFKEKIIFQDINLSISKGEIIGILGPNGSGKTTLFDLICNLRTPQGGQLINSSQQQLYLSQTLSPPASLRMGDIHTLITNLNSRNPPSQRCTLDQLETWSPTLGKRYADIWNKKPSICSYGEIRSFFTLTLLTMGGDLLVLDEPTAGVDPEFRYYIWLGIKNASSCGAAVLVSSHHTDEIVANCHRFYMLAHHHLKRFDSGEQFLKFYQANTLDEAFIKASL